MRSPRLLRHCAPLLPYAILGVVSFISAYSVISAAEAGEARTAATPTAADAFVQARELFKAQHHAEAFGRFAALADAGDARAASIALAMVTHGPALFGSDWSATPGQLRRWSALAAQHQAQRLVLIPDHPRGE